MGRQSFTLKWTAIGGDVLLEIPRNHLEGRGSQVVNFSFPPYETEKLGSQKITVESYNVIWPPLLA